MQVEKLHWYSSYTFPKSQFDFVGHNFKQLFVNASNYGVLGLSRGRDHFLLVSRATDDGTVLHEARITDGYEHPLSSEITNIKFLTHFNASLCGSLYPGHLEQLAVACPSLQQLNLARSVNCLRKLQGLHAIASCCQKLASLNILGFSVEEVENCVQLWKILADLQLSSLAIEFCCLQCFEEDQTKEIIIGLHKKCYKMKALQSFCEHRCPKCTENKQPLQLSYFQLLIYCATVGIDLPSICEKLRYMSYRSLTMLYSWSMVNCNLQDLCIETEFSILPDSFMNTISSHGGLVQVILIAKSVTHNGIADLIDNSPNLIVCHVYINTDPIWNWCGLLNQQDVKSKLEKKYSQRKLFLCGSYHVVKGETPFSEIKELFTLYNPNFVSMWSYNDD